MQLFLVLVLFSMLIQPVKIMPMFPFSVETFQCQILIFNANLKSHHYITLLPLRNSLHIPNRLLLSPLAATTV